jgi:hypothetical protein
MAITPGCEYDLFVSYAHADDIAADGRGGWIPQFVQQLEAALRQRVARADTLTIFVDSRATGANYHLPELLTSVKKSALFLAVGSPSYADHDWTRQELHAFVEQGPDLSRLFLIECLPLNGGERYPSPLDNHKRVEFWKRSGPRQIPMKFMSDAPEFSTLVNTLAFDITEKLLWLRNAAGGPARTAGSAYAETARGPMPVTPISGASPAETKKTILIAQTTDDVEEEADQLLRYLNQYAGEVTVLPRAGYPQGGEAFMAAFRQDLAQADLFVQLLGRRIGRVPPDLPQGYTRFQLESAQAAGVEIMQWRHPDLDTKSVGDPIYQSILTAETVVASGLEGFKSQVLTWARKRRQELRKAQLKAQSAMVFINADDKDMNVAVEISRECARQALQTFLPKTLETSEATRKDLEANLTDCDVLLFIYGDTTQEWIRTQLRYFGKVKHKRDADPKLLAICSGPPAPKPDIGVTLPNAHVVNCTEGWDMLTIRTLLAELAS